VRKWQRGIKPNEESQIYIAEALGWPADIVRADDWPNWLPLTADGVVPLGPHSSVPALRAALRTAMDRRTFLTISGATLSALAADWAAGPTSALAQARDGKPIGEASAVACTTGTPGWAAATLVLAQAEASDQPSDAAQRALDVLDRVPPSRLRATARTRLERLNGLLAGRPAEYVTDLRERLRTLPPPVDASGAASAWRAPGIRRGAALSGVAEAAIGVAGLIGVEGGEPFVRGEIDHAQ
jgi:hypothetical protein